MRSLFLLAAIAASVAGCVTYQSEGRVAYQSEGRLTANHEQGFPYLYAAISPETNPNVLATLSKLLKEKGYTVFRASAYRKVVTIEHGNPVIVFVCNDAGTTSRGLGAWSQSVDCTGYDLHSQSVVYEGYGEYMGVSVTEDYSGAVGEAIRRLPVVGSQGVVTSLVDLPRRKMEQTYNNQRAQRIPGGQGTGWLMPGGYIVTSQHIIEGATEIEVVAYDGSTHNVVVFRQDRANDFALLEFEEQGLPFAAIPISKRLGLLGGDVFTLGYPMARIMGKELKFASGKINAASGIQGDSRFYQISVPVQAGNSGGPLLNTEGEVIGVVTSKLDAARVFQWTGDLPQNVNYAMKILYLTPLVSDVEIGSVPVFESGAGTFEELSGRVKESVFMVIAR